MGKIYINCSRCGQDLECEELADVYTSRIDDNFLCKECFEKEKPDYIQQLKQQLAEKEEELLKQKEKSARTEQIYNEIIVDKDKEIEKLKQQYTILENENGKLTTELIMDKYKKAQKEVSFGKQLAIQELEKVKTLIQNAINFENLILLKYMMR